ncbi:MAG: hypothetical protein AB1333_02920 [Patescibacteria group bacterium]
MAENSGLVQIIPFKDKICFDCGKPATIKYLPKFSPEGKELFTCQDCFIIRERYFGKTTNLLPLEVICDGCKTDSHNEHHCEHKEVTVDGVRTHKSCMCEECIGDSSDVQKFIGSKI